MTPHRILSWLNRLFLPTVTWLKMAGLLVWYLAVAVPRMRVMPSL